MDDALIALDHIGKRFRNGLEALADLSLTVRAGDFLTLLGPSGCGKSTALRLMAGIEKPTAGTIINLLPQKAGSIGFVFQEPTLMPWARVAENVRLPLRLQHFPAQEAEMRCEDALRLVGLDKFRNAYPRELSGGMRMRVSIARALVLRPRVLLMDEPFAALDEITRFRLNDDLLRLKTELGTTIVFVTHSIYESVYLSTRIAVMAGRPGRVSKEIAVDLPRGADLRVSADYLSLCQHVSEALAKAAETSADGIEASQ